MQKSVTAHSTLIMLYVSMIVSLLLFAGMAYFILVDSEPAFTGDSQRKILVVALFLAAACAMVSGFLWKKDMKMIATMQGLGPKFHKYRSAVIKRMALLQGAGIFATVCFVLTGNIKFMLIVGIMLVALLMMFPSLPRVAGHINEAEEDIKNLPA